MNKLWICKILGHVKDEGSTSPKGFKTIRSIGDH